MLIIGPMPSDVWKSLLVHVLDCKTIIIIRSIDKTRTCRLVSLGVDTFDVQVIHMNNIENFSGETLFYNEIISVENGAYDDEL